ncbi:MAG: C40 family peptidase [Bacteroidota bacterium]|nr:C40 family peptidase [Bacteroidota bacterium]
MKSGITCLPLIPMRSVSNEHSEQVSQLLFGDEFEVIQTNGKWLKIRNLNDDYEAWIDRSMAGEIRKEPQSEDEKSVTIQTVLCEIKDEKNLIMRIPGGASVPKPDETGSFLLGNKQFSFVHSDFADFFVPAAHITDSAMQYINSPYLWGGKTVLGMDCSGFTQILFRMHGLTIPRDASQQVELGETICFRHDAEAGDLAFFQNPKGKIIHVGIILNNEQIIHASGTVRIDKLDHSGIYNADIKQYTHELSVIKRISIK